MSATIKFTDVIKRYPNMHEWHTGGGCMALSHPTHDGGYVLITDTGGSQIPDDTDETVICGRYDEAGECVGGDMNTPEIPVFELQAWIDHQLGLDAETAHNADDPACECKRCTGNRYTMREALRKAKTVALIDDIEQLMRPNMLDKWARYQIRERLSEIKRRHRHDRA